MILTYRYRIKDATVGKHLERHRRAVNFVWNYCCNIQRQTQSRWKNGQNVRWPTAFDLIKLCTGAAAELGLHSDTVQTICRQFAASRDAKRKCPRFRASGGPKRALGWIPFIPRAVRITDDCISYLKRPFRFWKSRELEGEFKAGCFAQDARGRWYVSLQCEVTEDLPTGNGSIGIDLGLKTLATCTDGSKIPALQHYRQYEKALGVAKRAGNKNRVKTIHAKIANTRRHHLHVESTRIVRENKLIFVGNVSASKLAKTRMAKSVLDASWSMLRNMFDYKARRHRACYEVSDEAWTTQTCSCCGSIPDSSPKGMGALGMRHWVCSDCGEAHDRDLNSARNILRAGLERQALAGEIPVL